MTYTYLNKTGFLHGQIKLKGGNMYHWPFFAFKI